MSTVEIGSPTHPLRVGVLEDDVPVKAIITQFLRANRFIAQPLRNGTQTLHAIESGLLDLLLLDLGLPGEDGLDILKRIRMKSKIPVLIISGRSATLAISSGLDAGADDYITKPLVFEELGARIRSVLRRSGPLGPGAVGTAAAAPLHVQGVEIDLTHGRISGPAGVQTLTEREASLLSLLVQGAGKPVSRVALTQGTVGQAWEVSVRTLDVHISNIRKKLETAGIADNPLKTVRNFGYRFWHRSLDAGESGAAPDPAEPARPVMPTLAPGSPPGADRHG